MRTRFIAVLIALALSFGAAFVGASLGRTAVVTRLLILVCASLAILAVYLFDDPRRSTGARAASLWPVPMLGAGVVWWLARAGETTALQRATVSTAAIAGAAGLVGAVWLTRRALLERRARRLNDAPDACIACGSADVRRAGSALTCAECGFTAEDVALTPDDLAAATRIPSDFD